MFLHPPGSVPTFDRNSQASLPGSGSPVDTGVDTMPVYGVHPTPGQSIPSNGPPGLGHSHLCKPLWKGRGTLPPTKQLHLVRI